MDYRYIFEYARRGALLPLDALMPKALDIADFGKDAIDSGRVDGKVYGVSLGLNSMALLYSKTAYESAGLTPPTPQTTWAQFAELSAELTQANKGAYWGSMDGGGTEPAFEAWVRQRGKALYTPAGKLGFDATDAGDWLAYWDDMRKRKACVPADVQSLDRDSNTYIPLVSERVGPLPAPPPNGAGEVAQVLRRINEEVGFGRLAPTAAGKQLVEEATSIIARG